MSSTPLALARDAPLSPISLSAASPWALALTALDRKKGGPAAALLPACFVQMPENLFDQAMTNHCRARIFLGDGLLNERNAGVMAHGCKALVRLRSVRMIAPRRTEWHHASESC